MKKLSLLAICVIFSMFFMVSCASDDDEVDTETGDTQSADTDSNNSDTTDTGTDTTDTGADTQADTAADTTDSAADTATDTDADTTADTTADTDADTTADTAADTTDTSADTTDSGADTTDTGSDTTDTGADTTDTGADTTDTGADTGDDSNLNTGDTSGNQAQSGQIGAACTKDSQCTQKYNNGDQEANCLFESDGFPGGYCTFFGDGTDSAACNSTGELFYNFGGGWGGNGLCLHRCTKPSDCRVGYRCSNKVKACLPNCNIDGYECFHGVCDHTEGVCVKGN